MKVDKSNLTKFEMQFIKEGDILMSESSYTYYVVLKVIFTWLHNHRYLYCLRVERRSPLSIYYYLPTKIEKVKIYKEDFDDLDLKRVN